VGKERASRDVEREPDVRIDPGDATAELELRRHVATAVEADLPAALETEPQPRHVRIRRLHARRLLTEVVLAHSASETNPSAGPPLASAGGASRSPRSPSAAIVQPVSASMVSQPSGVSVTSPRTPSMRVALHWGTADPANEGAPAVIKPDATGFEQERRRAQR